MRNNAVTLWYPYRPYCLANLIIAKRTSSSLLGLAWYRKLNRDMPSSKQVRRSDVFSFWRVWTTAWRTPSIVRPSALNNRGFLSKSIYQAVTLLQSSLDAHFPFKRTHLRKLWPSHSTKLLTPITICLIWNSCFATRTHNIKPIMQMDINLT